MEISNFELQTKINQEYRIIITGDLWFYCYLNKTQEE